MQLLWNEWAQSEGMGWETLWCVWQGMLLILSGKWDHRDWLWGAKEQSLADRQGEGVSQTISGRVG